MPRKPRHHCQVHEIRIVPNNAAPYRLPECKRMPVAFISEGAHRVDLCQRHIYRLRNLGIKNPLTALVGWSRLRIGPRARCLSYFRHRWTAKGHCVRCGAERNPDAKWFSHGGKPAYLDQKIIKGSAYEAAAGL